VSSRRRSRQDRETCRPPFDPEAFARESDSQLLEADEAPTKPSLEPKRLSSGLRAAVSLPAEPSGADEVPVLVVSRDDIAWFHLDKRALALVHAIDGVSTMAEVVSASRLGPDDAFAGFEQLLCERVIELRPRRAAP
jgi:hypothetical protein